MNSCNSTPKVLYKRVTRVKDQVVVSGERINTNSIKRLYKSSGVREIILSLTFDTSFNLERLR